MHQLEKRGRAPHPPWKINGFREAVADCGLEYFPFSGHQFTWVRSRGMSNMVEEKLDRILVTENWLSMFEGATACSLVSPYSDHLPLLVTPIFTVHSGRRKRFLFDNMWLREDKCREIVAHTWDRTVGFDVLAQIESCSRDIWRWGKVYNREFARKIEVCKSRMDLLRIRRDEDSMVEYGNTEHELLYLLEQHHQYWKQRAKEHWEDQVSQVMMSYFQDLFATDQGDMTDVLEYVAARIT
ncbi:PREDICTED: uncharacterized protein LOC109162705 [Ipomoea nil]|uniref:uncharacterized protein LOC109162705 n=1 Tax=Ipomoea nil TaxID=35883 RepID=UPI000900CEF2|nr:PREDICTED: uncharacterized protein LOC109162705 [Ipomoea nil]